MKKNQTQEAKDIKLPFLKRVKISIMDFDQYYLIAGEKVGKSIKYLLILLIIFCLATTLSLTYKFATIIDKSSDYIMNNIPDCRIENNCFSIDSEEPIIIENNKVIPVKFILDNTEDFEKYKNDSSVFLEEGYTFIFTKNAIITKTADRDANIDEYKNLLQQIGKENITKSEIVSMIRNNSKIYTLLFIVLFIIFFIVYGIALFINVLMLSLLGVIISKIIKLPLSYYSIFSIASSSITLSVILNIIYDSVNILTGFTMKYFQVMYTVLAFIYIISAIVMLKGTLIKNKDKIKEELQKRLDEKNNKKSEGTANIEEKNNEQ